MAYLDELTSHNTQLQGLIDKANALPDAGGSIETCSVYIGIELPGTESPFMVIYTDASGSIVTQDLFVDGGGSAWIASEEHNLTIAKNTLVYFSRAGVDPRGGDVQTIDDSYQVFAVKSDAIFMITL